MISIKHGSTLLKGNWEHSLLLSAKEHSKDIPSLASFYSDNSPIRQGLSLWPFYRWESGDRLSYLLTYSMLQPLGSTQNFPEWTWLFLTSLPLSCVFFFPLKLCLPCWFICIFRNYAASQDFLSFNWSRIDLQCFVSFRCTAQEFSL